MAPSNSGNGGYYGNRSFLFGFLFLIVASFLLVVFYGEGGDEEVPSTTEEELLLGMFDGASPSGEDLLEALSEFSPAEDEALEDFETIELPSGNDDGESVILQFLGTRVWETLGGDPLSSGPSGPTVKKGGPTSVVPAQPRAVKPQSEMGGRGGAADGKGNLPEFSPAEMYSDTPVVALPQTESPSPDQGDMGGFGIEISYPPTENRPAP